MAVPRILRPFLQPLAAWRRMPRRAKRLTNAITVVCLAVAAAQLGYLQPNFALMIVLGLYVSLRVAGDL
jgi:hypothetical protein